MVEMIQFIFFNWIELGHSNKSRKVEIQNDNLTNQETFS